MCKMLSNKLNKDFQGLNNKIFIIKAIKKILEFNALAGGEY